jgi:plastocyanin
VTGITVVLGVIAALMVSSAILTVVNLGDVSASEKEGAVEVKAKDTEWEPTEITASPTGKIVLDNADPILHTFTIDQLDIDVKMGPGKETLYTLKSVPAGEYAFRCKVVGHEDMDGVLTVR